MKIKRVPNNKGFTFTEVLFVAVLSMFVIGAILSVWVFTNQTLSGESKRAGMRVELLKLKETIRRDIRESYVPYMAFYPDEGAHNAISMPLADVDANGFYERDADDNIIWDKTVVYHIVDVGGEDHLRRSVVEPWTDALKEEDAREQLIEDVVEGDVVDVNAVDLITEYLDYFTITSDASVIDFYDVSVDPVKARNVIFGYTTLDSGDHTIRFTVAGKNPSSSGYGLGVDNIKIDPCGSAREAEYYDSDYAQSGSVTSSGSDTYIISGSTWSNDNYLEYGSGASAAGQWIQLNNVAYDLWRESSFEDVSKNNVTEYGSQTYMKLELPEDREEGKELVAWSANAQTQDEDEAGTDGLLPGYPVVMRTFIKSGFIENDADLVRILLKAPDANPIKISAVYITRKETEGDYTDPDGLANQSTSGLDIEEFHRHQQVLFKDVYDGDSDSDTDEVLQEVWIPAGEEVWSEWTAFPMVQELSSAALGYLVTFCVPDLSASGTFPNARDTFDTMANNCKYWQGTETQSIYVLTKNCTADSDTNIFTAISHGLQNNDRVAIAGGSVPTGLYGSPVLASLSGSVLLAGDPDWSSKISDMTSYYVIDRTDNTFRISSSEGGAAVDFTSNGSNVTYTALYSNQNIFEVSGIDTWMGYGTVESQIFDTTLDAPGYTRISWSEEASPPSGTERSVKVRSSDNTSMSGASDWDTVTAHASTPSSASAGSGRYVQFFAELSTEFFWRNTSGTIDYEDYIDAQVALSPWQFPDTGDLYQTIYNSTWIDDVTVEWDGGERICMIRGDIARKNDYGAVQVQVDGEDLIKILRVDVRLSMEFGGKEFEEKATLEIEPREDRKIRDL